MAKIKDSDILNAMIKSVNNDLNMDPFYVKEIEEKEIKNPTKVSGQYISYNGLDVQNLKHPIFGTTSK